jgi:hypothetical protein
MYNGVRFVQLYFGCLILTLLVLDMSNKTLFLPIKLYLGNYMLLPKILMGMFQTGYNTLLFETGLLYFGIISRHLLQISLETGQIIMGLPIEPVELNILLLHVLNFPSSMFCLIQLIGHVLVFMLDPIQLSFDYD